MVVFTIITMMLLVAVVSQSTFNKTLILSNTAYDVALTIRTAQVYGLGTIAQSALNTGYGVHFDNTSNRTFTFFIDSLPVLPTATACHPNSNGQSAPDAKPGNCYYDGDASGEKLQTYTLNNGIRIKDFCVKNSGWHCATDSISPITSVDIVFARPNPDVSIGSSGSYSASNSAVCILLESPHGGNPKYINVGTSGAITASLNACQ